MSDWCRGELAYEVVEFHHRVHKNVSLTSITTQNAHNRLSNRSVYKTVSTRFYFSSQTKASKVDEMQSGDQAKLGLFQD